jgi:hypothetical protein
MKMNVLNVVNVNVVNSRNWARSLRKNCSVEMYTIRRQIQEKTQLITVAARREMHYRIQLYTPTINLLS